MRYRFDRTRETNRTSDPGSVGLIAPERRHDSTRRDQDFAVTDTHVVGSSGLNEFRFQFDVEMCSKNTAAYCAGCAAENRQGILLGKSPVVPGSQTQDRWQIVNAFTWLAPDRLGDHALKMGLDVSLIDGRLFGLGGADGIWRFTGTGSNRLFDPADASTYPVQFIRFVGEPVSDLNSRLYTLFVQDQWKPLSNVTFNLGVRWDYEDAVGAAQDKDNVAPRIGVAVIRGEADEPSFAAVTVCITTQSCTGCRTTWKQERRLLKSSFRIRDTRIPTTARAAGSCPRASIGSPPESRHHIRNRPRQACAT